MLDAEVIAVDETWCRLMEKGASKRWWVWSVAREDVVCYRLLSSRSTDAARTVLDDFTGVAICAGYKAYDTLAREREDSDLTLAHCWAHVRRKFVEAEPHYPEAAEMVDRIRQLYAILRDRHRRLVEHNACLCERSQVLMDRETGLLGSWKTACSGLVVEILFAYSSGVRLFIPSVPRCTIRPRSEKPSKPKRFREFERGRARAIPRRV